MASSFSDLGIELMATGENAGTWGTKTNTNLQIVEKAIGGYVEKAITSGGTTALTITDGDATESTSVARHAVIKLTGTITGNSIVTVPDSIEKVYIVTNGTSGAYTVQFKTASGTGITFGVSEKTTRLVYSDGTNIVDAGFSGASDLEGRELVLDADGDTTITADTDDQIDIKIAGTDQIKITDGVLAPVTDNDVDLGTSSLEFKDGYFDGTLYVDAINFNGTAISSTAAELNILDGVTATATELNKLDGDTSATSTTVADADRVVLNDNGTMVQVAVTDLAAYFDDEITAMPNLVTTAATTVGALNSGSITSGFGTIDTGSSTITTTGLITGGSLDIDDVLINGTTIGHTDDTDLLTVASGLLTVAGEISVTTLDIGGTNVTSTAAELNILDGVTSTATEINIIDGDTSASSVTVIDADRVVLNDGGTMKQVAVTDLSAYFDDEITAMPNLVTTGALNSGSISSGFGNIDIGSSNLTATGTISLGAASFNDNAITNVGDIALDSISADATDINIAVSDNSGTALTIKQGSDAYLIIDTANSSESVSIGTGISGTAITLGHSTSEVTVADNLTVTGDLTVSGTTTTVNSTTVNLNDHNIVLDSGNSTSAVVNGGGITLEGGSGDDATFTYNTTGPKFELKLGSSHEDLQVDQLIAASLDISGDVDVDGTLEADAITVNGTTLAETISDTTGAMFSSNTETGVTATYQDGDNTIDLAIDAAQTTITSLLATDIKIGEDDQTKIDFETADEIHFYAANVEQVYLGDNIFGPQTDSDVDLGSSSVRWKDAYVDTVTSTSTITTGAGIVIADAGNIGSASDTDAIAIASNGVVTFSQTPVLSGASISAGTAPLTALDIDGATDIGEAIVDADLFIVDNGAGGTNRKVAASRIVTYIDANSSAATVGKAIAMAIVFG